MVIAVAWERICRIGCRTPCGLRHVASLIVEDRPNKPFRVDWLERGAVERRFATRKEVEAFIGDLARGKRAAASDRLSFDGWVATWLRSYGPEWDRRTRRDRADYLDRFIRPEFGGLRLDEIGRPDVRSWRAHLVRRGVTPHVANRAVSILSAAVGAFAGDDVLAVNPCAGLRRLPEPDDPRQPATPAIVEGTRARLDPVYYEPPRKPGGKPRRKPLGPRSNPHAARDRAIVSLMAYAGLRPSELPRVHREDVRAATLLVRSTKRRPARSVPIIPPLRKPRRPPRADR